MDSQTVQSAANDLLKACAERAGSAIPEEIIAESLRELSAAIVRSEFDWVAE